MSTPVQTRLKASRFAVHVGVCQSCMIKASFQPESLNFMRIEGTGFFWNKTTRAKLSIRKSSLRPGRENWPEIYSTHGHQNEKY